MCDGPSVSRRDSPSTNGLCLVTGFGRSCCCFTNASTEAQRGCRNGPRTDTRQRVSWEGSLRVSHLRSDRGFVLNPNALGEPAPPSLPQSPVRRFVFVYRQREPWLSLAPLTYLPILLPAAAGLGPARAAPCSCPLPVPGTPCTAQGVLQA